MRRHLLSGTLRPVPSVGAALVAGLCLAAPAPAQEGRSAPDSVALLLEEGARARAGERAASVRRALALWERAAVVAGRRGDHAALAEALHRRGEALGALSVYDSATASLGAALALRRETGDGAGQGRTLVELARVDLAVGRTGAADARAREALASRGVGDGRLPRVPEEVEAGARTVLGIALRMRGRPDSAFAELRAALELRRRQGDARGEGEVLQALGDVYRFAAELDTALAYYQRALALQEAGGDLRGGAWTLRAMGVTHGWRIQRDLEAASAQRALARFRETGERRGEALARLDLGRYQRGNGWLDSAALAARQSLAQLRGLGDRWGEAAALAEVAADLALTGDADSARVYLGLSLERFRETGDAWMESLALGRLGDHAMSVARPDSAIVHYRRALEVGGPARAFVVETRVSAALGAAHARLGRPDSARARYGQALRVARRIGDAWMEMWVLRDLADLARGGTGRDGMGAAVALYDTAAWALARIVSEAGGDRDRLGLVGADAGPWASWTLAWLAREAEVGTPRARLAALAVGERGRAQALLALMRRSGPSPTNPPRGNAPSPGADLAAEGQALLDRARAGGNAVLLYHLAGDTLLRWLVPPSGAALLFRTAVPRDSLAALVASTRRFLGAGETAGRGEGARRAVALEAPVPAAALDSAAPERLARLLLPDSLATRLPPGREVVIVPGGVLNLVPFAALRLPDGEYLGARHALRYAPSLASLVEAEARPAVGRAALSRALVVGNPAMPTVTTYAGEQVELDSLPGAGREADEVAERLGARPLHGAAAGETAVLALLPGASLVHLATHGFAYSAEDRAHASFVALAPGGGEDGLLTVAEVLAHPGGVPAELVVLSACQSGLGNLQDAEGTVGLQRAFLAQGARSVMVSLWSVSDRGTEALMRAFYAHWLGDADRPDKAEALRRAQGDVRGTPGMESPLFWAAFQLAGAR